MSQYKMDQAVNARMEQALERYNSPYAELVAKLAPEVLNDAQKLQPGSLKRSLSEMFESQRNTSISNEYSSTYRTLTFVDHEIRKRTWLSAIVNKATLFKGHDGHTTLTSEESRAAKAEWLTRYISAAMGTKLLLCLGGVGFLGRGIEDYVEGSAPFVAIQNAAVHMTGIPASATVMGVSLVASVMGMKYLFNGIKTEFAGNYKPSSPTSSLPEKIKAIVTEWMVGTNPPLSNTVTTGIQELISHGETTENILSWVHSVSTLEHETIKDLALHLENKFLVPKNNSLKHAVGMLSEYNGHTGSLYAHLETRAISDAWEKKYEINPATINGRLVAKWASEPQQKNDLVDSKKNEVGTEGRNVAKVEKVDQSRRRMIGLDLGV